MTAHSLPDGVTLNRSQLGCYSVEWNGDLIGWIHASLGNRWNAYARTQYAGGLPLGRFNQHDAVKAIASAAGWKNGNETPTGEDSAMNDDSTLAWRNRRILAERLNWPSGALETCEHVEHENPEWHVTYSAGGDRTWSKAGFYASRKASWRPEPALYGADANGVESAIRTWRPPPTYGLRLVRTDEIDSIAKQSLPELIGSHEISELLMCDRESVEKLALSASFPPQ